MQRFLILFTTFLVVSCQPPGAGKAKSQNLSNKLVDQEIMLSDMPAALERFRRSSEDTLLPRIDFKVTELDYTFRFILAPDFLVGNAGKVSDDLKKLSRFGSDLMGNSSVGMVGTLSQFMDNFTAEKICTNLAINQYEESVEKQSFSYIKLEKSEKENCPAAMAEFEPLFRQLKNYESYAFKKGVFPLAFGGYINTLAENELFHMRTAILSEADLAAEWKVSMAKDLKTFVSSYLEFEDKMHDYIIRDEQAETVAFDPVQRESIQTLARNTLLRLDFQSFTTDDYFENIKKVFRNAVESLEAYASESNKVKIDYYRN